MGYSKLKSMRIKNFRNIKDMTLSFDKSPIITLIGDNEAGKTSVVKSIVVLGLNGYTSEQKDYIRDNTTGFGIMHELEDGTMITRVKSQSANCYAINKGGQVLWSTDKIDRGCGVPVEISKVMGMIEEPETKEYIHVRTYEDQLLFVFSKASENYKVMYDALKVYNLAQAIKNGTKEVNDHKAKISIAENSVITLRNSLRRVNIYDITPLKNIKARLKSEVVQLSQMEKIIDIIRRTNTLKSNIGVYSDLANADDINEMEIYKLDMCNSMSEVSKKLKADNMRYSGVVKLNYLETLAEDKMFNIMNKVATREKLTLRLNEMAEVGNCQDIETQSVIKMDKLISLMRDGNKLKSKLAGISLGNIEEVKESDVRNTYIIEKIMGLLIRGTEVNVVLNEASKNMSELNELIKNSGAVVTECSNCGETVVVDLELIG